MASEYHAGPKAARTAISEDEGTVLALKAMKMDNIVSISRDLVTLTATRGEIDVESLFGVVKLGCHG